MPMTSDAPQTVARRSRWKGQNCLDLRMAETLPAEEEEDIDDEDIAEEDDEEEEEA
jgi:hypothetical protein